MGGLNLSRLNLGFHRRASGSGAAVPEGAIAEWYFDDYESSPRRAVPNAATDDAVSTNLISAPRRLFDQTEYYAKNSLTVTELAAAGPDGSTSAAALSGTSNWSLTKSITLPAGTFTFALDYKRNTTSDQDFRQGVSGDLVTETATDTWQTYTHTITVSSGGITLFLASSPDGTTGGEILIDNFRMYSGSSDLGAQAGDSHIYLGQDHYDSLPTEATGGIDVSTANSYLLAQFSAAQNLNSFTMLVSARKTTDTGAPNFQPFWAHARTDHKFLAAMGDAYTNGTNFYHGDATVITHTGETIYTPDRLFNPVDPNFQVRAYRYDGSTGSIWIDGIKYRETSVSGRTASVQDFWNLFAGQNFYSKAVYNSIVLYDSALSDDDLLTAFAALKARTETSGVTTGLSRFICFEGDSITNGGSGGGITYPYPFVFQPNSDPLAYGDKRATGGSKLADLESRAAASVNDAIPADKAGRTFVYSLLIGTNDFNDAAVAADPEQFAADVGTFTLAQKAAGWDYVVLGTLLPSTKTDFNAWRNTVNGIWTGAGWAGDHGVDGIADYAADGTIGPDAAASDTDYYSDGTHPTDAAITIMESILRPVLNGL